MFLSAHSGFAFESPACYENGTKHKFPKLPGKHLLHCASPFGGKCEHSSMLRLPLHLPGCAAPRDSSRSVLSLEFRMPRFPVLTQRCRADHCHRLGCEEDE